MLTKLKFLTNELVVKATQEIDKNGIPDKREGVNYKVLINNKEYPFKLLITEAAKLENIELTSNDFSSDETNRKEFEKLTNFKIVDIREVITFINLEDLINKINASLGGFCYEFQTKRKQLLDKDRMSSPNKLFVYGREERSWAINKGGGTELQYHLFLRDNLIGYGLGFNTQYVPFANDLEPVEYMKPYVNSFLAQKDIQQKLEAQNFKYLYGSEDSLKNLTNDDYILIGKSLSISSIDNVHQVKKYEYDKMLEDLKGVLFKSYNQIVSKRNSYINYSLEMQNYIALLKVKKQIILQGPPGTGKTRLAKQIAKELAIDNVEIIQFHPSYTYEDFVRGITIKNNGDGLEYITENKILASIAEQAHTNWTNHHKEVNLLNQEAKLEKDFNAFLDFIEKEIEDNQGFLQLTDNVGLINLDEDAFRYKGKADGWIKRGNRMLFKDIKQAYLDGNKERQDLKKNTNLSGLAKQHASYFVRVLNKFQKFIDEHNLVIDEVKIEKEPLKNYVLIIDEINRANLSSVLGELIYALEYRGKAVDSMYAIDEDRKIVLPNNLFIIGTMNTADRSVGQIDYAIRRRFAFVKVLPEDLTNKLENEELEFATESFKKVASIFEKHLSLDFKREDVQLGHSYFIYKKDTDFSIALQYEIKPILHEYIKDGILEESEELFNAIEML